MSRERVIIVPSAFESRRSSRETTSFFVPPQQSTPSLSQNTPYSVDKEMTELFLKHGSTFNASLPATATPESEQIKSLRQNAESTYDELEALANAIIQGKGMTGL